MMMQDYLQQQPPRISRQSRNLRDELVSAVFVYYTNQYNVTLQPNGVTTGTGFNYNAVIQGPNPDQVGILLALSIDTTPDAVSIAVLGAAANISPFGQARTSNFVLTRDWLSKNILSIMYNEVVLVGRSSIVNITLTNTSAYSPRLIVTYTIGLVQEIDMNFILTEFGHKRLE